LQANFEIPNVEPLRSKIISNIGLKFRTFKSRLTSRYIFGDLKDENPCLKYKYIDEDVRIYGFKLEGGKWFKEDFRKLLSQE